MKKTYAILIIYEMLENNVVFMLKDLEEKLNCSRRTAIRYLNEIRDYFKEMDMPYDVEYKPSGKTFRLVKKEKKIKGAVKK